LLLLLFKLLLLFCRCFCSCSYCHGLQDVCAPPPHIPSPTLPHCTQEFFANVGYAALGVPVPCMALYHVHVEVTVDGTAKQKPTLPTVLPTYILLVEYLSVEVGGHARLGCDASMA
jgi:hypothetical protein